MRPLFTLAKPRSAYTLAMGTKQHTDFCPSCGKTTNHVTRYKKDDGGGQLRATVQCAEHSDSPAELANWQAVGS